jgi:hypothetical protein
MEAIWSMNFKNLKILREFFIEFRSFNAMIAALIELLSKAFWIS